MCPDFSSTGVCPRGSKCKLHHRQRMKRSGSNASFGPAKKAHTKDILKRLGSRTNLFSLPSVLLEKNIIIWIILCKVPISMLIIYTFLLKYIFFESYKISLFGVLSFQFRESSDTIYWVHTGRWGLVLLRSWEAAFLHLLVQLWWHFREPWNLKGPPCGRPTGQRCVLISLQYFRFNRFSIK